LTLIRPLADSDEASDAPTLSETIQTVRSVPEPDIDHSIRFRPLRLFATGGQGLVYVAHDKQLGREVALKELKPRNSERKITRHRFIREAEITGSLEHPGIVPVYALGRHADGRPYYAMRLIQGRTLHDAVQHYYSPELKVSPVDRNLLFRKLLQRFVSVCQTVAYAHSRGIIHRDLKPANVLLGQYGEALVADWGLARPFHATGGCESDPEFPVEPDPGDPPSDATMMGSALGTPAYMSPEQSEGRWDEVGPATDVYSLGATLFTILTGQPPMPKLPWSEAHRRIINGEFPTPKQLNPNAPRGLVAICRKAMAINQSDRYSSALALSEDIEHWLADEPVSAEPEPWGERAQRWIRRHRTFVFASGVLWITAGITLGIGLIAVNQERDRTQIAYDHERTALDRTHTTMVDEWLGQQRELSPEHKRFLADALNDYERLAADTRSDPATRLAVVRAFRRVGEIRQRLGEQSAAKSALDEAAKRIEQLSNGEDVLAERAFIHRAQGLLDKAANPPNADEVKRLEESAEKHFAAALAIIVELDKAHPGNIYRRRELAAAYNNHAASLLQLNRGSEAISEYQSALELRQQLAADSPDDNDAASLLASGYESLGQCYSRQSLTATRQAKDQLDNKLIDAAKDSLKRAAKLADKAEENLKPAAELAEKIVGRANGHMPFHEQLATVAQKLGRVYLQKCRVSQAKHWLEIATVQLDKLMSNYPSVPEYRLELVGALNNLGRIELGSGGWPDAAVDYFDRALDTLKPTERMEATMRCDELAKAAYAGRAEALSQAGRHADSADAWAKAAEVVPEKSERYLTERALQLLYCDRVDESTSLTEEIARSKGRSSDALYNCACVFAQASALQPKLASEHKRRAIQLLREIAEKGYFKSPARVKHLDEDVDLNPIRDWPEYEQFRSELEK
jgi:serine/threonine-protein kinase